VVLFVKPLESLEKVTAKFFWLALGGFSIADRRLAGGAVDRAATRASCK
jgi:hypothetical protein